MSTQYTPSHWINDGTEISAYVDHATSRSYIAPVCSLDTDWHPDIVAANARLIAAAPDLLVALRDLLEDAVALGICESNMSGSAVAARAAIAKATGGAQ